MINDLFNQCVDLYEKGEFRNALRVILKNPDVQYEKLSSKNPLFHFLINYADASVFKGLIDVYETNIILQSLIKQDKSSSVILQGFLEVLSYEEVFQKCFFDHSEEYISLLPEFGPFFEYLRGITIESEKKIESIAEGFPAFYQENMQLKLKALRNWKKFQNLKLELAHLVAGERPELSYPWHLFSYSNLLEYVQKASIDHEKELPLLFLEPIENFDYRGFLSNFNHHPSLFIFESFAHFFQMFQFDAVVETLSLSHSMIYILDLYPHEQWNFQECSLDLKKNMKPIFLVKRESWKEISTLFMTVLQQCLNQPKEDFKTETSLGNWLYQLSKRMRFNLLAEKYGESRFVALKVEHGYQLWHDLHKGLPPPHADLGPPEIDYLKEKIDQINNVRTARSYQPKKKIKLVHIVPQVVDGGHAPSKLLRILLAFADKDWFELFLVSTERLSRFLLEYPVASYISSSSEIRGKNTLSFFKDKNIDVFINEKKGTYEHTAKYLAELLKQLEIDIAVFHGPDEINSLCSSFSDVPIRVLFDHGTLPTYPSFDLVILSSEETYKLHHQHLKEMGMESAVLPFCIDVRMGWKDKAYTKEELGFSSQSILMTTISNHLASRLSVEMCQAIGEILRRCPNTLYVPIGAIHNEKKIRSIFEDYGVNDRVIFLGYKKQPSQYARSMDLYLNEFPFGSGLGILDAMASGCPVVSMYDEKGPQQARYGATYFGIDHVIKSGKKEDYIELACHLIQDRTFYEEWSEHAKKQYEKHVNMEQYVKTFEHILERYVLS